MDLPSIPEKVVTDKFSFTTWQKLRIQLTASGVVIPLLKLSVTRRTCSSLLSFYGKNQSRRQRNSTWPLQRILCCHVQGSARQRPLFASKNRLFKCKSFSHSNNYSEELDCVTELQLRGERDASSTRRKTACSLAMEGGKSPSCILLFSGKRKSGKDFFTDRLLEACGRDGFVIIKISAPIKSHFAKNRDLNLKELMSDGEYKETYRKDMIDWSEEMRRKDPGIFCRSAVEMYEGRSKKVWIVSDVRRKSDIKWFKDNYGEVVKTIRIEASCEVRKARGWNFVTGVDDVPSECDLDDYNDWDWKLENNGEADKFKESVEVISKYLKKLE